MHSNLFAKVYLLLMIKTIYWQNVRYVLPDLEILHVHIVMLRYVLHASISKKGNVQNAIL